jgi:hypothetical protein
VHVLAHVAILRHRRDVVPVLGLGVNQTYLYPLCTATTPKVMSRTVGDLNPAMANCESSSNCDGCFLMLSTR